MNNWLLLSLIVAHILGDFYAQSDRLCQQKEMRRGRSWFLYVHALIIGGLSWALVPQITFLPYVLFITISHWIIDWGKSSLDYRMTHNQFRHVSRLSVFLIDQFLHIIVLAWAAIDYETTATLPLTLLAQKVSIALPLWLTGALVCIKPANILIKLVLKKYQIGVSPSCNDIKNAGALIGNLERLLTLVFVLINQYEAIGFIIAAKSVLRFKDTDTAKTEYVLAGTLLSFGISVVLGILIKHLTLAFS